MKVVPSAPKPGRWSAAWVFNGLGLACAALTVGVAVWLATDQWRVVEAAAQLHAETVPWTLERQRLGRNLEALRLQGERALVARTPEARRQALFLVSMMTSHPGMQEDTRTARLAGEVQHFLTESGAREVDVQAWNALSERLRLLADDLSVEGGQRITLELERMTDTMARARYKLIANLVLVIACLLVFMFVARRYLIRPLQRIDRALTAMDSARDSPRFPAPVMTEIGAVEGAIVRLHATLEENERVRHELVRLATTDPLTALSNRRHFNDLASAERERALRYLRPTSIGIVDIDHFKYINDGFGHLAGDQVLQVFAQILRDTLRSSDHVCRYGGEEFAFLFPETTLDEAARFGERLRERVAGTPFTLTDGTVIRITLSLGLADASAADSLDAALARADGALYEAKQSGRNRVVVDRGSGAQP